MWRICLCIWLTAVSGFAGALPGPEARALAQRATRCLDRARLAEARSLLARIETSSSDPAARMQAAILRARIRFETGDWIESVHLLRQVIDSASSRTCDASLLAEAYLQYADACRALLWLERYHRVTDTVGMLVRTGGLPDAYRARYVINKVLYFAIQVMIDRAIPYVDSLEALMARADLRERHRYRPVLATVARITFHRNHHRDSADAISRRVRLDPDTADHVFDRIALWRAVGNVALDNSRSAKGKRWTDEALQAFARSRALIDRHFPRNDVERLALYNLSGLTLQYAGASRAAAAFFERSEAVLRQARYPVEAYVWAHAHTGLWKRPVIDAAYAGARLQEERLALMARFKQLARIWGSWRDINRIDSVGYYRNPYSSEPEQLIVNICHDLYRDTRDPRWIDSAFQAQERSRYPELCQRLMHGTGLSRRPVPPPLGELRKGLQSGEALISFSESFSTLDAIFAVVLTRDTLAFLRFDTSAVGSLYRAGERAPVLSSATTGWFKTTYLRVYRQVFRPIEACLDPSVRSLLVYPSTRVSLLPLELILPDTTGAGTFGSMRYLGERYAFRYDHSWTVSALRQMLPQANGDREDMVFVPHYGPTPEFSLPFFESQARRLGRDYGFRILEGDGCSLAAFARLADKARILQLSAHGHPSIGYVGDQYIDLNGRAGRHEEHLNPTRLLQRRLDADLAVLAICEGGIGEPRVDGVHNFMYWFTFAGSRSCLFSHWKLDDRSTGFILDRFYRHLSEGHRKSDALRLAKADYRASVRSDEELNPIYWAGLTLVGDDAPLDLPQRRPWPPILVGAGLLTVMGMAILWGYRNRLTRGGHRPGSPPPLPGTDDPDRQ